MWRQGLYLPSGNNNKNKCKISKEINYFLNK